MKYYQCIVCREAYFLTTAARTRHQQMCLALNDFYTSADGIEQPTRELPEPQLHKRPLPQPSLHQRQQTSTAGGSGIKRKTTSPSPKLSNKRRSPDPATESTSSGSSDKPRPTWYMKKGLQSARDYVIENVDNFYKDLAPFLEAANDVAVEIIRDELQLSRSLKYNTVLEAVYCHPEGPCELMNFKTTSRLIHSGSDELEQLLKKDAVKLLREESEAQSKGSGWTLHEVKTLTLRLSKFIYAEPRGSSYIPLPHKVYKRKACVNVRNTDEKCYKYSILTKHIPNLKHDMLLTQDSFDDLCDTYNFDGLTFPTGIKEIKTFEANNDNTSVNVFECDSRGHISPLRIVKEQQDHFDLLLIKNEEGESHYVYITDFVKLMQPQVTKGTNKITICKRCSSFKENRRCRPSPEAWLSEHLLLCGRSKPSEVVLPDSDKNQLRFQHYEMQIKVPIIIAADFESTLHPIPSTNSAYQRHEANSFCTLVKSSLPQEILNEAEISLKPYLHRSENAGAEFLLHMQSLARRVEKLYSRQAVMIPLTEEQLIRHRNATICDLCETAFDESSIQLRKVRDHDHISGHFRHSLCSLCNTRCQLPNFIPVYFHNLSSYDQAYIIKNLAVLCDSEIKVIPANSEKFISISVRIGRMWLRFLDSYRLMAESLANLASNLSIPDLIESSKLVPAEHINLITCKGHYPYDYVTSYDVFAETSLPPREKFYNQLNDTEITDNEYNHACSVWEKLNMKNFGEYHDFYLTLDVTLLMDVITCFRDNCFASYKIDCCHSFTAPGLAWQSMLRMTGVTLELLSNYDHFLMFESAIRGGLVQCCKRYEKANNSHLENQSDFNPNEETTYMLFLDCVNLYGKSMQLPLPTGNFEFVERIEDLNWSNLSSDSPYGLLLEADITIPDHLHDAMNDFPILPEQKFVPGTKQMKLLATLENKTRYIAHYTVFQQAVKLGLKITKVHRALRFSQSPWMRKFIDFNTDLRSKSTNAFSKSFYKFMNNSVFGKTLENVRNRVDIRIVTTDEAFLKLSRQARFVDRTIIADNVIAVHLRRPKVVLNKPIFVGMTVLDLAKFHMNEFHYNVMKKLFVPPDFEIDVNYSDTDSLLYSIRTKLNLNNALKEKLSEHLDRSCYPPGHELWLENATSTIGTFKDECKGRTMYEYIGLRCKMYSYRFNSDEETTAQKKAKGIKSSFVKNKVTFEQYRRALFEDREYRATFNQIRCRSFNLTSQTIDKLSLTAKDDKRHILEDKIHTLAYGHYSIRDVNEDCE